MEREIMRPETREGEVQLELVGGRGWRGCRARAGGAWRKGPDGEQSWVQGRKGKAVAGQGLGGAP